MIINYETINGMTKHYLQCLKNNNWEDFNFEDALDTLACEINEVLLEYGQVDEEYFIQRNVEDNFPWCHRFYLCHYGELGYYTKKAIKNEFENVDKYRFFDEFLSICEEVVFERFHELQKQYGLDHEIRNLQNIFATLVTTSRNVNNVPQEEMIAIIKMALNYAKHPTRNVFNLNVE